MKLIEDNSQCYVIKHPDGSLIKIAKENLSPDLKVRILAMADGGVVPDKGFIPIRDMPMTPPEEVVPIGVLPTTPPESKFTGVSRATKEEQMQPATFAPGTADVYKTAVDQPRPVRQAPIQPYVPEQAPGGAEEAPISPLDFPMEAASLAGAGAKGLVRGAMAGREALYKAVPRLASEVGAVGGQKVAPRINPLGMYSKLEQTIAEKMGGSATPEQIKGMLRDVKPEEMQYSGLNDFLQGKNKVSKQEILDFVKANELPVQEKIISNEPILDNITPEQKKRWEYLNNTSDLTDKEKEELYKLANIVEPYGEPKFSQYTLPGGENYREKLYTLPQQVKGNFEAVQKKNGDWLVKDKTTGEMVQAFSEEDFAKQYAQKLNGQNVQQSYKSSHWDEPNVLAHTRLNDRIDDEGRKHLFVEEIQSDWHQAGRKEILNKQKEIDEKALKETGLSSTEEAYKLRPDLLEQKNKISSEYKYEHTPDAPMKKTWQEFVSKNLLNDAAKGGYDNISWTTGAQQAERYDLSKHLGAIKSVPYEDGGYQVQLYKPDGKPFKNVEVQNLSEMEQWIGKEPTEKLIAESEKNKGKMSVLSGLDLKVGGEGMKGFYDKMIPDYMAKIGKKYGVKPEKIDIPTVNKKERSIGNFLVEGFKPEKEQVWTMKITPEMRKDILEKGLPLYSVGGIVAGGMLNGKEAEAKDMNYKLLENNKDHYVMRHPDGSSFKVAKKGLNPEIMKKIEGYADFVQRAEGQIPGVDMPEQVASAMPEQPKEPDFAQMVQQSPKTKQDVFNEQIGQAQQQIQDRLLGAYAKSGLPESYTPERIRQMAEEQVLGSAEQEALKTKNQEFLNKQEEQQKLQETLAYNERAAKVGMPLRPLPGQKQEMPMEAQAKQMAQPEQPQPQQQAVSAADPFALYEKGIKGEAAAKAEYAKHEAETYKKLQEDVNNGNKMFNDKLAKMYEDADALQKSIQTNKVDPNRYWSNAGVANKISASIALILGGIGGALTKTDNAALKIIDKTIDNDIEAQKKNIDQGNNLYKMNLERIKDEKEAYAITKAQMIGMAEMKLKQQLATSTSKEAISQGQIALGKMELAKQEYLKQTALNTVVQAAQSNPQLLTPEIIQRLPEKDRELVVPGYGFAISKAGAEKIRTELLPQKDTSVQMINDLMNLREKYGREITNREVVNEVNALRSFLRGQMRTFLVGPGAVTESEQKILDNVISDPTKILTTDAGTMAALNTLKNSIEKSFNNQAKANGLLVPQAQAQGQQPVRGADGKFYIQQGRYMVPVNK